MKLKNIQKKVKQHNARRSRGEQFFLVLLTISLFLGSLNIGQAKGLFIPDQTPIKIVEGAINLNDLTTEQKIAQMVIVQGERNYLNVWGKMQLGGIHMFARQTENIFNNTIIDFQSSVSVPYFVSADLEGCVSPFKSIKNFTSVSEITTKGEAFEKGYEDGRFLHKLGFNLNFAPVVDLEDTIWGCRSFPGDKINVAELAESYVLGLQNQNVIATAKHYPGKTLVVKDPHKFLVAATIGVDDVYPYTYLIEQGDIQAIMVSHVISTGAVDSHQVPAVVSSEVYDQIRETYNGLIISDEIHMLGLKFFFNSVEEMYIAVFKAGNDVVLNFDRDPNEVYRMIQIVADAVDRGEIDETQIDESLKRIYVAKGLRVV